MADVNKPEVSSESLQATPPVAVNGDGLPFHSPPPPLPTSGSSTMDWKIWGLELAIGAGMFVFAVLLTLFLGYGMLPSLMVGLIISFGSSFGARAWLRRSADTKVRTVSAEELQPQTDGFREIIETIVFVVVLVLLLKSFAAEAFVIPTGSMAETLYGYQRIIKCPQCGVEFPVNCSPEVDPQQGPPMPVTGCTCPQCRYFINFRAEETNGWKEPDWNSGDRVLVAKFLYELFNKQPNRLDVVVFKYPGDSHTGNLFPRSGPMKNHTPMNYIKRLVGLPGETIAIHRGRLYVLPPGSGIEYGDWKQAQTDEELRIKLWQWDYMHNNDPKAEELFKQEKFTIIRKPPETMLSMRRPVYDNDHPAKDLQGVLPPRWSGDGWKENGADFQNPGSAADFQWLHYHHYLRDNNLTFDPKGDKSPVRSLISDFMGYNFYTLDGRQHGPTENWVGDLMLEADVSVDKTDGEIVLELSKSRDRFRMTWSVANGDVTLSRLRNYKDEHEEKVIATKKATQPKAGSTYRLRFANFDDRLTVWIDSTLPFDDGVTYVGSKEDKAGPTVENDLEPASLGVKGAGATVRHLKLWRDTYYTAGNNPSDPDANGLYDLSDPSKWEPLWDQMKLRTLYVQPEHFLCLGDNSPESSDGRSWGLVPERLLLGRAMLVYYPFGRAGRIR
jgi:signal peptidase I